MRTLFLRTLIVVALCAGLAACEPDDPTVTPTPTSPTTSSQEPTATEAPPSPSPSPFPEEFQAFCTHVVQIDSIVGQLRAFDPATMPARRFVVLAPPLNDEVLAAEQASAGVDQAILQPLIDANARYQGIVEAFTPAISSAQAQADVALILEALKFAGNDLQQEVCGAASVVIEG